MKNEEEIQGYSHIVKYAGLFGGVQGLNILIGVLRNKFVATILGPAGMGLISLFNSTITFMSNATNLGISMSAVRNLSEAYDEDNEQQMDAIVTMVRTWSLLTALVGMFLCMALSPLLNDITFDWGDHTLHFVFLSPIVALLAITGGEAAILKATRRLKGLAVISVYNVLAALLISVPLYYFLGEKGIVPSLVVGAGIQMLLTIRYSIKLFPLHFAFDKQSMSDGLGMVRLGIAFVLAGILGSGAEFLIRSFLNYYASLEIVGLYSAGYMMTMTYAGMVFSAMETDYFPRLSAVNDQRDEANLTINRQIEVSLLLVSPLLVAFTVGMPVLVPLLYSGKFTPVMGMVQVSVLAMYLRAVKLPMAYIPLAKGDSKSYLFLEAVYDIVLVGFIVVGYLQWGLTGCGIALLGAGVFDWILIYVYAVRKYGYVISNHVKRYCLYHLPVGLLAYAATFIENRWAYWLTGALLFVLSGWISLTILRRKTSLWSSLMMKIKQKLSHG
ncbi:MAG: oligosaccharide flippase family protein [Prevotella sp.]|nr:oligosaccharide flippase family protein [Prevotella sp.]